jgi:glycosyltransferase involved in cell wall biosynthesis
MNVLIDATSITKKKAGVGVYAKNLIDELTRIRPGPHFFVLAQDDDPELDFGTRDNVSMIRVPARLFRLLPLRLLLEQAFVPFLLVKHRIDVIHSLHYSFPLLRIGSRQVVTLHDMTFFNMPEVHKTAKIMYFRVFIRAAIRFADKVIFVSHSALQDCTARFGPLRASSEVIHLGKSDAFIPDLDPTETLRIRMKYGLPEEFILYVGMIEPRKNLPRLVAAFAMVSEMHPGLSLVIAGIKGWMNDGLMETICALKMESRVIFTGFIPEPEKPFLIAASKVFAYPSLYEGFGIPVLEALACGIPTLTSNISSLPEVAGDAALMIDPQSVTEISLALERLLSNESLRGELRQKSLHQAAKFNWVRTATMTLRAYEDVLSPDTRGILN